MHATAAGGGMRALDKLAQRTPDRVKDLQREVGNRSSRQRAEPENQRLSATVGPRLHRVGSRPRRTRGRYTEVFSPASAVEEGQNQCGGGNGADALRA